MQPADTWFMGGGTDSALLGPSASTVGKVAPCPALEQGLVAAEQRKRPVATGQLKDEPEAPNELHPPQQSPSTAIFQEAQMNPQCGI